MIDLFFTFVVFFAVIDPIGTVPVFIAVTAGLAPREQRLAALKATLVAAGVLVFFLIAGEPLLDAIGTPLPAFQIAGGIVLFVFALTMIFGESKPESEMRLLEGDRDPAIFPLAVPSIASPGAMLAAVMETENARLSIVEQAQVGGVMLSVLVVACLLMLAAAPIPG